MASITCRHEGCPARFVELSVVAKHEALPHSKCDFCPRSYSVKGMTAHVRRMHKSEIQHVNRTLLRRRIANALVLHEMIRHHMSAPSAWLAQDGLVDLDLVPEWLRNSIEPSVERIYAIFAPLIAPRGKASSPSF